MNKVIFIFSYNREEMLKKVVEKVKDYNYFIIDDGSDFFWVDAHFWQFKHFGKENWWKLWDILISGSFLEDEDLIIFTPDDFLDLNIEKIFEIFII